MDLEDVFNNTDGEHILKSSCCWSVTTSFVLLDLHRLVDRAAHYIQLLGTAQGIKAALTLPLCVVVIAWTKGPKKRDLQVFAYSNVFQENKWAHLKTFYYIWIRKIILVNSLPSFMNALLQSGPYNIYPESGCNFFLWKQAGSDRS